MNVYLIIKQHSVIGMPWKDSFKVFLNVYDFTTYNSCLSICNLAGFHSGIEVKYKIDNDSNLQYSFCVVDSNPLVTGLITIQPQTADYTMSKKLYLGQTKLTQSQLAQLIDELSQKYTCGKYNMFYFNCNHFSDQLARRLVGSGVPKWLFTTTNFLKYVCCCLPQGLVSGKWAIEAIEQQQAREQQKLRN